MTPGAAIKHFKEKYPPEAIASLQEMENDRTIAYSKFGSIELTESCDKFTEYLDGYVAFKTANDEIHREGYRENITNDDIMAGTDKLLNKLLFHEKPERYSKALDFVLTYLEGLSALETGLDDRTKIMFEGDADPDDIGLLTTMTEAYVDALTEKVDRVMDQLLRVSGYRTKLKLTEASRSKRECRNNHDYFL